MAIYYSEFDSTTATLIKDLKAAVLTNPDWTSGNYTTAIGSLSAAANAAATSVTVASGTLPAGFVVGSMVRIGDYAGNHEWRQATSVSATSIGFATGLSYTFPIGTSLYWGNEVVKATTVRGANMIVDFVGGNGQPSLVRLPLATYGGWTAPTASAAGIVTGGLSPKYLYYRRTGGAIGNVVHCVVSSSKDHLFISVEGPRGSETGSQNGVYGSAKNYFFVADLVPYSTSDVTPVVVAGGSINDGASQDSTTRSWVVTVSKNLTSTSNWVEGKLLTLQVPNMNLDWTVGYQRFTTADDEFYLAPYVLAEDDCGFRGRLNNIYSAGFNFATNSEAMYPMTGAEVVYNGITYKLQTVNKSDASYVYCGPLGMVDNIGGSQYWKSPIVAIPIS